MDAVTAPDAVSHTEPGTELGSRPGSPPGRDRGGRPARDSNPPDEGAVNGAQAERRQRILDAAVALARTGGYDAVQMREVAASAEVALGTLYRYFPSKEHLLVSVLHDRVRAMTVFRAQRPLVGDDPSDRVVELLRWATRALQTEPLLTGASLQAFVSPEPSLAEVVRATRDATTAVIVEAMHPGPASTADVNVARYLQYLWMSCLTSWINGASTAVEALDELEDAARMLLSGAAARAADG